MRDELFSKEKDRDGFWLLSPLTAKNNGKFMIRAKSEIDAQNIIARLVAVDGPGTPHEEPSRYRKVRDSGETPVYELL
jgi:hypothetical protein